jgi:predicted phage terminase large subunit-like protein
MTRRAAWGRYKNILEREYVLRCLAGSVLANFIEYTMPEYRMGWFHETVCSELDMFLTAVSRKESPRLIITAPPQHGKSEIISRRFPAYVLGKYPDMSIISTSYSASLASKMSRDVQRIIKGDRFREIFPLVSLAGRGSADREEYKLTENFFQIVGARGQYLSAGVGGGITGVGAECVAAGSRISVPGRLASTAAASELAPGDLVWSYSHQAGRAEPRPVLAVKARQADRMLSLDFGGAPLLCTPDHPVWADGGYRRADILPRGASGLYMDYFNNVAGEVPLLATSWTGPGAVVDLQVEGNSNFFADGVLVHNCILVDDPIKNREEADSATVRESLWDWYSSVLSTRQRPGAGIVIVHTRWHEDDLVGRLMDRQKSGMGSVWRCLNFPAIAEKDEDFRRQGEALHPERYPLEELLRFKADRGSRDWAALYQQRPAPDEGQIFRRHWFRHWHVLPDRFDVMALSWDMTFKDGSGSDYVVGQVWGKSGAGLYLVDQVRARMGFVETKAAFKALAGDWPQATLKLVEDKANGPAVIDELRREIQGIVAVSPDGSKTARASAVTALFEAGNVYFPDRGLHPWVGDLEAELLGFPAGMHDDQVDALTQALRRLGRGGSRGVARATGAPARSAWDMSW